MGLDLQGVRFLLYARRQGVSFARTAMLGRQELHLDVAWLHHLLGRSGDRCSRQEAAALFRQGGGFAEPLLRRLGAEEIVSLDAAAYEGASVVHDLNRPIPPALRARFTAVIDGGTLEHVFDVATALRNALEMVAPGGHFLGIAPANNFFGHGFYQFSPEIFYRTCAAENGYAVEAVFLAELSPVAPWFAVADPAQVGRRARWVSSRRAYLLVLARRVALRPVLAASPQQSDYKAAWAAGAASVVPAPRPLPAGTVLDRVPHRLKVMYHVVRDAAVRVRTSLHPAHEPACFRQVSVP